MREIERIAIICFIFLLALIVFQFGIAKIVPIKWQSLTYLLMLILIVIVVIRSFKKK